jgi:proteasome lid subunit RPN8/RPN11
MGLKLSRQQRQQLLDWADEAGEMECCGLLLGAGDIVERVEQTANIAMDPHRGFEIDPVALIAAEKQARQGGSAILGYFHSHPNGRAEPSSDDAASASADGRYWLIIADGEITSWLPLADGIAGRVTFAATGPV